MSDTISNDSLWERIAFRDRQNTALLRRVMDLELALKNANETIGDQAQPISRLEQRLREAETRLLEQQLNQEGAA